MNNTMSRMAPMALILGLIAISSNSFASFPQLWAARRRGTTHSLSTLSIISRVVGACAWMGYSLLPGGDRIILISASIICTAESTLLIFKIRDTLIEKRCANASAPVSTPESIGVCSTTMGSIEEEL